MDLSWKTDSSFCTECKNFLQFFIKSSFFRIFFGGGKYNILQTEVKYLYHV